MSLFGKISLIQSVILALSLLGIFTDVAWGRVYNWMTFPAILGAFGYFISHSGVSGASQVALGVVTGFCLYVWMFALGTLGAGDVKLLMALGAWGGWQYARDVAILSLILGGCMALVVLMASGKFIAFVKKMYIFILSIFLNELEFQSPKIDKTLRMPFAVPIGVAAIWVIFGHSFF